MTNTEKAISLLQQCLDEWPYAAVRVYQIMSCIQEAVGLLKEQEPKSPCTDCQEFVCDGCKYLSKKPSDSGDGYEPPEGACAI